MQVVMNENQSRGRKQSQKKSQANGKSSTLLTLPTGGFGHRSPYAYFGVNKGKEWGAVLADTI